MLTPVPVPLRFVDSGRLRSAQCIHLLLRGALTFLLSGMLGRFGDEELLHKLEKSTAALFFCRSKNCIHHGSRALESHERWLSSEKES